MRMRNKDTESLNRKVTNDLEVRGSTKWKGNELWFPCFQNEDAEPSAHWNEEAGEWKCFSCGSGGRAPSLARLLGIRANNVYGGLSPSVTGETMKPLAGLTLAAIAEHKRLQVRFLQGFGVSEYKYQGIPRVRIPYHNTEGDIVAVRSRLKMGKGGFIWRKGDHPILYGLERLSEIRAMGEVLLVEGESDTWTAWHYNIPVLGIPGKANWRPEWAKHLEGLIVYLWQEPDAEDLTQRVVTSIPELWVIRAPEGTKDVSEAHIQGKDVSALVTELKAGAFQPKIIAQQELNQRQRTLREEAELVFEANDPLSMVEEAIRQSYGGDTNPATILYLAVTSRLLAMDSGATLPVHLLLMGPSSAGKSFTWLCIRSLLPEGACHVIDAGSPRVLIYDDTELAHKVLVFHEADSLPSGEDNPVSSAIRNLLTDHRLNYKVVVRDPETGEFIIKEIRKDGPTVLITTATRSLGDQMNTRLFHLDIPYDRQQVRSKLRKQADREVYGVREPAYALIAYQDYLQTKAPWRVVVPFAHALVEAIDASVEAPRIMRDFERLLSLIKSVAVLRHVHRDTSANGRLEATLDDYAYVYELVGGMYETSLTGVSEGIRKVVNAVKEIIEAKGDGCIRIRDIERHLGIGRVKAYRDVRKAIENQWLVNNEPRKGNPYILALGDPLPEAVGLPSPETLQPNVQPKLETEESYVDKDTSVASGFTVSPLTETEGAPYTSSVDVVSCANTSSDHVSTSNDGLNAQVLTLAEQNSWRLARLNEYITIQEGEGNWRKFVKNPAPGHLELALRALEAME